MNIIVISLLVIMVLIIVIDLIKGKKEQSISDALIGTGISIIAAGIPGVQDSIIEVVAKCLKMEISGPSPSFLMYFISGLVLIFLGFYSKKILASKTLVLNMYGIATQKDISDVKAISELNLAEFTIKEQVIDFISFFDGGTNITTKTNSAICKYIETSAEKFGLKSIDQKATCFTGMAPIPYTIYAGTFLENANITRYFEYNAQIGGHYSEVKKARKKEMKDSWNTLDTTFPTNNNNLNTREVVLAISVSHKISENDLNQFNLDVVHLALSSPMDNSIKYRQQLEEYKNAFYQCVDSEIIRQYPNIETIHIIASIPSCLSIEIGKSIGMRTNRMCNMIVYHYIRNEDPPYVFGLYVNGTKKGEITSIRRYANV